MNSIETINSHEEVIKAMAAKPNALPEASVPEVNANRVFAVGTMATVLAAGALIGSKEAKSAEEPVPVPPSDNTCIGPNLVLTRWFFTELPSDAIPIYKVGVGTSLTLNEANEPPVLAQENRKPLSELLSDNRTGEDGFATPPYNGGPSYTGEVTLVSRIPDGPIWVTRYDYQDDPTTPYEDRSATSSSLLNCSDSLSPIGEVPVTEPGVVNPPLQPLNVLKPGLSLNTAKILPKSRRGNLKITSELSRDSTCSISGVGDGAHKNSKLRNQAARIEVSLQKTRQIGKLPKGMIGLKNGEPVKKGQKANVVSIDLLNSGLKPGQKQINNFAYELPKGLKAGGFSARLIIPARVSECGGSKTISAKLSAKAK